MAAPKKDTDSLVLRVENKLREEIEFLRKETDHRSLNQCAAWLLQDAVSLASNPDQCPPLSPEMMRLRSKLHGRPSGTYADEPGRPPEGPTVVGNMQANDRLTETVHTLATLLAAKDAEIERLRALAFPVEKKTTYQANGGAA